LAGVCVCVAIVNGITYAFAIKQFIVTLLLSSEQKPENGTDWESTLSQTFSEAPKRRLSIPISSAVFA